MAQKKITQAQIQEIHKILNLLRDIDMKVNHIIERLKSIQFFDSLNCRAQK